jgi:peptidyl-prolyl cis-trans isomerase B (cyclophilin B)
MRPFLIITFALLTIGFIGLFFYVQNTKPKNIIDETKKQASELTLPYKNNDSNDVLTTPSTNAQGVFDTHPTEAATTTMQEAIHATTATIKTSKGDITIELYPDVAPKTVSNFASKAKSGYYANLTFHRVEDWVLQGGDPLGTGTGGGDMPTEFNDKPFTPGAVGVARRSDPSVQNDSQFFIVKTDATFLNKQYTNFGMVTSGMDVVNKMEIGDKILSITVE